MVVVNIKIQVPKTIKERRQFIVNKMQKFKGKKYKCPALSNADVYVIADSIKETIAHASKEVESTIACLYLDEIIKNATYVRSSNVKSGTQTKRFKFTRMYVLHCKVRYLGVVKLTIGSRISGKKIQYCLTAMR